MEYIRKHPKALVAVIAVETVILSIVAVAGMASATNYDGRVKVTNPICNMSAGAAANIGASRACDYTAYPQPGTRAVTTNSDGYYAGTPAVIPGNGPNTQYRPQYPFNSSGQQVSGWTNTWTANPPTNTAAPATTATTGTTGAPATTAAPQPTAATPATGCTPTTTQPAQPTTTVPPTTTRTS